MLGQVQEYQIEWHPEQGGRCRFKIAENESWLGWIEQRQGLSQLICLLQSQELVYYDTVTGILSAGTGFDFKRDLRIAQESDLLDAGKVHTSTSSDDEARPDTDSQQEIIRRFDIIERLIAGSDDNPTDVGELEEVIELTPSSTISPSLTTITSQEQDLEAFIDALKLPYFRGREFTPYWSRVYRDVQNSLPPNDLWPNIVPTLVVLNALRQHLNEPIVLTSTYRSPAYNKAIGGAKNSFHQRFQAIDFSSGAGNPCTWAAVLKRFRKASFFNPYTGKQFAFQGGIGVYRSRNFVHLDTRGFEANWFGTGDSPC